MKNFAALLAVAGGALIGALGPSHAEPLKTMDEVGAAIQACWNPPADTKDSSVTLRFSFKRDGTLIGPPRPSAVDVNGDEKARQEFVDAAANALQSCLPLDLSPEFAAGIAGNTYTMQFTSSGDNRITPDR